MFDSRKVVSVAQVKDDIKLYRRRVGYDLMRDTDPSVNQLYLQKMYPKVDPLQLKNVAANNVDINLSSLSSFYQGIKKFSQEKKEKQSMEVKAEEKILARTQALDYTSQELPEIVEPKVIDAIEIPKRLAPETQPIKSRSLFSTIYRKVQTLISTNTKVEKQESNNEMQRQEFQNQLDSVVTPKKPKPLKS